ncbi:MAG: hypothetical protein WCX31_13690 [Salinivirgaceae bacterium]
MENNIILYSNGAGNVSISVSYQNDTFWLPQRAIAQLFGCSFDNVSLHLKNIFISGELEQNSVTEEFSATANDGNISHEQAVEKAHREYEQFRIEQDKKYISDLDKVIKNIANP